MVLRKIVSTVIGLVLANLSIFGLEAVLGRSGLLDLGGLDGFDIEYVMRTSPPQVQIGIVAGWAAATAIGAFAAFSLGRSDWTGWIVAGWVATITAFGALGMYPYPLWLMLLALLLPFVGTLISFGLYRRWRAARLHLRG